MKKIQTFAVTSLMALAVSFALASCSSDDIIENGGNNTDGKNPTVQTVFSCGDDDLTRTSINNKRAFFWEKGDKIWVYDGSQWQKSTKSNIAATQTPQAKFVLSGNYTDNEYQLLYTGYTSGDTATTQYNKVTVTAVQTQKKWNDGSHLGTSGDCGTARAYRQANNTYRFSLEHKASYLLIYPFLHTDLTDDYTLEKIEVYSDLSASTIAGTFDFDFTNGLADSPDAGTAKQEMTLNCGNLAAGEFGLPKTAPVLSDANNAASHCFMIIAPGDHQLTIRYVTKKSDGTLHEFIKDIALKQYKPNGVYTFVHELKDAVVDYGFRYREKSYTSPSTNYCWGATTPRPYDGVSNPNRSTTQVTDDFWANIPSREAASWYVKGGGYWDNATKWTYVKKDGTEETHRGGAWLKKKAYLATTTGFSTIVGSGQTSTTSGNYVLGRPDANEISNYFFIPSLSNLAPNGPIRLWTSTPWDATLAWSCEISPITFTSGAFYAKDNNWLCYPLNEDGSPWWQ